MGGLSSLIITLYAILQVCVLVEGLYQLEVTVFGYDNPTGRCQCDGSQRCCESSGTTNCGRRCDSYFRYCLRTIGSTGRDCSYFGSRISARNNNDGSLDFSRNTVLNLENPIILRGLTDTYNVMGVQLHIEVIDEDDNPDDLIDVLLINHSLPIGQPALRQTYTGIYSMQFVTMDLSIVARCVENFQGPDCSRCLSGFAGSMCDVQIDDSECIDLCNGRGQCIDGVPMLICDCDPGFTGAMCENIDDCVGVNCSGNGQCVDGESSYSCDCDSDYAGMECEVKIDDCMAVDCSGNGQCMDGIRSYTCDCVLGFTGMECEINIDDCVGVNCSGNGQCVDEIGTFSCNCNDSYTGGFCETRIRSSGRISTTVIGGVLGAIAFVLALLIILVIIFIVMYKKHKVCYQAKKECTRHEVTTVSVRYTKSPTHQLQDTEEMETSRTFDNPIYCEQNDKANGRAGGSKQIVDQSRLLSMSLPDHEFDNPIYATEETDNAYSTITDVSTQNDVTNGQLQAATYESIHDERLPGSYRPLINGAGQ